MTALVALCLPGGTADSAVADAAARARRALGAVGGGGTPLVQVSPGAGPGLVALGVTRAAWEEGLHPGDDAALASHDGLVVAADASLFYREALASLTGTPQTTRAGAATAIAAALARQGDPALAQLEGDFALVAWDPRRSRLLAARDFSGRRTLHYALAGDALLLASSPAALLADPAVPHDLDLATLASVAAGLWSHADATAYRAIRELPAGHLLEWRPGNAPVVRAFWQAPDALPARRRALDDAAAELRELLVRAVDERMPAGAVTGVSLSGGWDSTAVFAAGCEAERRAGTGRRLHAVSISYPVGDPGREDELIEAVLARWQVPPDWIAADDIPLWGDAAGEAARRTLPFAHTYAQWNRRLWRAAAAAGARVMLDGAGGDQLFQVSDIYLSDLLRTGQWAELTRQAWSRRALGLRHLWRWGVRPALPASVARAIARLRGFTPPGHHFDREPPRWFRGTFMRAHGVMERERAAAPLLPSGVLGELHAYLRYPFYPRMFGVMHDLALEEGVEARSPLMDARILRFAAARPWSDRVDRRETKLLLRHAMRGLLPDEVLAPRPHRTGVTTAYFFRQLRGSARPVIDALLQDPLLASLGMIDAARLRHAWAHVLRHDDAETAARLWFTVQAELWLRAHAPAVRA